MCTSVGGVLHVAHGDGDVINPLELKHSASEALRHDQETKLPAAGSCLFENGLAMLQLFHQVGRPMTSGGIRLEGKVAGMVHKVIVKRAHSREGRRGIKPRALGLPAAGRST